MVVQLAAQAQFNSWQVPAFQFPLFLLKSLTYFSFQDI